MISILFVLGLIEARLINHNEYPLRGNISDVRSMKQPIVYYTKGFWTSRGDLSSNCSTLIKA
jgi:hypothetical protein